MRHFLWIVAMVICFSLFPSRGWAEKAYVLDNLKITFRSGPSLDNKVIRMLSSGRSLEVLESQGDWSRVQIMDDSGNPLEGWVMTRYLMDRLPWKERAETLDKKVGELQKKLSTLDKERQVALAQKKDLAARLQKTEASLEDLKTKYENLRRGSSNYLELKTKYMDIQSSVAKSREKVDTLSQENQKLRSSERNRWFGTGALVLLSGLLIGVVMGRKQRNRKSIYD
ncbi:MAG: TIGR04211 family SH3 domain-containing protein [Desulfatiglandaceae bacterium]